MSCELILDIYSNNVKVSHFQPHVKKILLEYSREFCQRELIKQVYFDKVKRKRIVKYDNVIKRVFVAATEDRTEFRFHITCIHGLLVHLKFYGIREENMQINYHPIETGEKIDLKFIDKRIPRDEQTEYVEYIQTESKMKVLPLQTGGGKTLITNHAINKIRQRTLIIVKGMYVKRWLDDINEVFDIKPGEMIVIRGSSNLIDVIELAKAGQLDSKIIIMTNTTFRMFIDDYESKKSNNLYGCNPEDFMKLLKIGLTVIDEVHQDFHLNFKIFLYAHVNNFLSLSATLESDNEFINKMYTLAWPLDIRPRQIEYNRYIKVTAMLYSLNNPYDFKYKQKGRDSYSHVVFEEYIMKNKKILNEYFFMITDITQKYFVDQCLPEQKFLIFCSTVEFCTLLTEEIKQSFPQFRVNKFTGGDDEAIYGESDIIISTLKSSGTAKDIPDLAKALLTVAIGSRQANEQAVGRLRVLKRWPEQTPEFIYLTCTDILPHIEYHEHKREVLQDKVLSVREIQTGYRL